MLSMWFKRRRIEGGWAQSERIAHKELYAQERPSARAVKKAHALTVEIENTQRIHQAGVKGKRLKREYMRNIGGWFAHLISGGSSMPWYGAMLAMFRTSCVTRGAYGGTSAQTRCPHG